MRLLCQTLDFLRLILIKLQRNACEQPGPDSWWHISLSHLNNVISLKSNQFVSSQQCNQTKLVWNQINVSHLNNVISLKSNQCVSSQQCNQKKLVWNQINVSHPNNVISLKSNQCVSSQQCNQNKLVGNQIQTQLTNLQFHNILMRIEDGANL